jgi:hypothetical protein
MKLRDRSGIRVRTVPSTSMSQRPFLEEFIEFCYTNEATILIQKSNYLTHATFR